ncbi:hemolysin family protein [Sulfitobacter guttiformis]|uniref:Magnesium and cobalt transporter n=1 Tax=Sulfitobacter guttiformis TaxID=74349 RepID=A0A420DPN4_9RHOB|nr:hemolysin family protein [Sulfitobacter guttiformis]KIN73588.1 Hemolysin [Sulfitobacter guttiformis KCTC 32187]RKE96236.1 magnesium and cobalt transporter [Sulfitobacter guttiformis]
MGDTDGPSTAAQSAQDHPLPEDNTLPEEAEASRGGFFSRVIGALSPSDGQSDTVPSALSGERGTTGMGNLRRMRVDDVMIPKADIIAVSISSTLDELVAVFKESGMTRLPVYDGTLDTPVGLAHLKDLALQFGFNGKPKNFNLAEMARPLVFVPPSMTIGVLLTKMQAERRHMALVIDEYGGVDGLVTIEDLIEQVIGQIEDEHDVDEGVYWSEEKPGQYLALAKTPLSEFENEVGQSLTDHADVDEEEIDTLGGLVVMLSGRVPARGEVVVHPDGPEFEIMDADPRRIKRLRVRMNGSPAL